MASKVLPQALISIPGTTSPCHSKKLGFTNFSPSRFSSSNSNRKITISRVSLSGFGSPIISQRNRQQLFVVRAEPNSEEGGEEVATTPPTDDDNVAEAESKAEVAEGETLAVAVAVAVAEEKPPRKPRIKMGDIMGILNQRAIEATDKIRPIPDLRAGDIVELKLQVPKNRRRAAIYKGIVISKQNAGIHTTIRVRRIIAGIGVEIVFPVYSPNVKEIKVVKHRKVRRARLYYLRDKLPRFSTFK